MTSLPPAFTRRASFALVLCAGFAGNAEGAGAKDAIESRSAEADGVKLHYLTAGHGPAVILLHGYAETSRMWRPLIPRLAEKFTVIAPDLPGIGDSDIPKECLSPAFVRAARRALTGGVPVLGTVALAGGGFIAEAKRMPGAEVITLSRENRERLPADVAARLSAARGGRDA